MSALSFKVNGLCCADECSILRKELGPLVGGEHKLLFDVIDRRMTILDPPSALDPQLIRERVAGTGMSAVPWELRNDREPVGFFKEHGVTLMACSSAALLLAGFLWHWIAHADFLHALQGGLDQNAQGQPVIVIALYALSALAGGWFVFPRAWRALRRLRPDMHLLMTVAVIGAALLGDWFEAATVTFLFALSLALESWSMGRARQAVQNLLTLAPAEARLLVDGTETLVAPELVPVGSIISIRPGERIALDGMVLSGTSEVNEAPLTGESMPVFKGAGIPVMAGSINGSGALVVITAKKAGDAVLAQMIRLVQEARNKRAPTEQWVDWFAARYTPVVLLLSILLMLLPALATGDWAVWFYRGLVLLVIACPCALVISTPVSMVAALASAARQGVLVKGGEFLELAGRIKAVAFDKTGTLTEGRPRLTSIIPLNGHTEDELLQIGAGIESRSEHPLAQAVVAAARDRGLRMEAPTSYTALPGLGAEATLGRIPHWIGSPQLMSEKMPEAADAADRIAAIAHAGQTAIAVGTHEHVCGLFGIADSIRPAALRTVQELKRAGIAHLSLLTGDNAATAKAVAGAVGIDDFYAGLLPADKVEQIEELRRRFTLVALVGDGVNDAPALAAASVGIAMGAAGSDAALETADVALMGDDLLRLPWLVRHSRRTMTIIRQNITLAIGIKVVFVLLAASGHASLWAAIAADMGTSLLVIFNALRLLRPAK